MANTAAVLNILVTANTAQANAALARTQAQLAATTKSANVSAGAMGAKVAKGAKVGALALGVAAAAGVKAAADWENAFAGVRKTVNATDKEFGRIEKGLRGIAKTMPVTATEVADLAAEAGALGIKSKDIVKFTKVAAMLGEATDMSANDAANGLARLSNVMGTSSKDFERLGATLVALGNKGASTEAEILSMAQRMAGAAKIIGLTEAEVLSMSSALASVGIRAEMGGSAIARVWLQIDDAVAKGGAQIKAFANIAGMSVKEFEKLFDRDANAAVIEYAAGLKKAHDQGRSVTDMLKEVDLNEIRVRETLLKASAAHKDVAKTQEQANRAWAKGNALNQEAQTRYKTVASQAQILKNRVNDLFISLGQKLEPATRAVLKVFNDLAVGKMPAFVQSIQRFIGRSKVLQEVFRAVGNVASKAFGGIKDIMQGVARAVEGAVDIIEGVLTGDWAQAWNGVKKVASGAIRGVIGIVKTLTAPVRAAAETVWRVFKGAFQAVGGAAKSMLDKALGAVTMVLDGVAKGADLMSKLPGPIGDAWDKIQTAAEDAADSINRTREKIRGAHDAISKSAKGTGQTVNSVYNKIPKDVDKGMRAAKDKGSRHGRDLAKNVGGHVLNLAKNVHGGMKNITGNVQKSMKGLGIKKQPNFGLQAPSSKEVAALHAQKGVLVPGRGNGDKVPAMLEPGEVVINKRAVAAMGGAQKANRINKKIPRFQRGGLVQRLAEGGLAFALGPQDVPPIKYDPAHAGSNSHWHISGNSSSWVVAIGKQLQQMGFMVGEHPAFGGVSASHGHYGPTDHYHGGAIDVNSAADETLAESKKVAAILGGSGIAGGMAERIARVILKGPDGPLKETGQAALDKVRSAANQYLQKHSGSAVMGGNAKGSYSVEQMAALWQSVNGGLGSPRIAGAVGMAESAGDPNAFGPPDGRGLWQIEWNLHPEVHKYGSPYDPTSNARMAGDIYRAAGGWSPWVAYTNNSYQQFLQNGGIVQKLAKGGIGKKAKNALKDTWQASKRFFPGSAPMPSGVRGDVLPGNWASINRYEDDSSHLRMSGRIINALKDPNGRLHDDAIKTLVHEFAHVHQKRGLDKAQREGGAEAFAQWAGPQVARSLGIDYGSTFLAYPDKVAQVKGDKRWWKRGQFLQGGGVVQKLRGGGEAKNTGTGKGDIKVGDATAFPGLGKITGHGGESPDTPLDKWFQSMGSDSHRNKMKGIIGGIGLRDERYRKWRGAYSNSLDYDEFASMATQLDIDDPTTGKTIYGIIGGNPAISGLGGATGWLNMELAELLTLRNQMVSAKPVVDMLTKFVDGKIKNLTKGPKSWKRIAARLRRDAERRVNDIKRKISNLERRIGVLQKQLGDSKGKGKKGLQGRIAALKQRVGKLKEQLPFAEVKLSQAKAREGGVDKVAGFFGEKKTGLAGTLAQILKDGAEDGSWPSIESLQGRTKNFAQTKGVPPLGMFGGDIFRVQMEIESARRTAAQNGETVGSDSTPTVDTGQADLAKDLARQLAISQAQYSVFANFPAFAKGGTMGSTGWALVGERGPELAHLPSGTRVHSNEQSQGMLSPVINTEVRVFVGDKEITDIVRVEQSKQLDEVGRRATARGGVIGRKAG
jgi:TP901 family phage tail tape measure protein